ncbi:hypothetical protein CH373_05775 [Leptospira perolatii]|uniref:Tetratricopeptide repeat protein n=1 Tax=Leptospira perolatii TaxID=2023191 RepID=A0A2M9ZR17_9LEPT|nr:tetratricopeptide repeat protein [Leptospira perolatii]PJZ70573.1 hypothetical protein CH360_06195 [Leptospira perolatii]PJZ74409.1 hypothetical protein CH373_05775 [Leptospira perolatii]
MAKSVALSTQPSVEESTWELFETEEYKEVIRVSEAYPNNVFINHLRCLAELEIGSVSKHHDYLLKERTILTPLVSAYLHKIQGKHKEAAKLFHEYFRASSVPISYSILKVGILTCEEAYAYQSALDLISRYKALFADSQFARLEFYCNFHVRNFEGAVSVFKENLKIFTEDRNTLATLGICLVHIGRFEEAKDILEKLPGAGEIPSFEEKTEEYKDVIQSIPSYEKRRNKLSEKELLNLGFGYLFSESFEKAEKVFLELIALKE